MVHYRLMRSNIKDAGVLVYLVFALQCSITEAPFLIWSLSQFRTFQEMNIIIAKSQQH